MVWLGIKNTMSFGLVMSADYLGSICGLLLEYGIELLHGYGRKWPSLQLRLHILKYNCGLLTPLTITP